MGALGGVGGSYGWLVWEGQQGDHPHLRCHATEQARLHPHPAHPTAAAASLAHPTPPGDLLNHTRTTSRYQPLPAVSAAPATCVGAVRCGCAFGIPTRDRSANCGNRGLPNNTGVSSIDFSLGMESASLARQLGGRASPHLPVDGWDSSIETRCICIAIPN